jgi:hypothetical protein
MGVLLNYLNQNPRDRWARFKLVSANSGDVEAPMAVGFARSLRNHYAKLSLAEKSELDPMLSA